MTRRCSSRPRCAGIVVPITVLAAAWQGCGPSMQEQDAAVEDAPRTTDAARLEAAVPPAGDAATTVDADAATMDDTIAIDETDASMGLDGATTAHDAGTAHDADAAHDAGAPHDAGTDASTHPTDGGSTAVDFLRGVYQNGYEDAFDPYQAWFGPRRIGIEGAYNSASSWDTVTDPSWVIGYQPHPIYSWRAWVAADPTRRINAGINPFPGSGSLHTCASGAYDGYYRTMGTNWVAAGMGHAIFRFAWEEDGNWFAWTIQSQDANHVWHDDPTRITDYKTCFQHFARAIRSTDPQAVIAWDAGPSDEFNAAVYPGDDVVDHVSRDVYDEASIANGYPFPSGCDTSCMTTRQATVWNTHIGPILVRAANFATAHHKPFDLGEWGEAWRPDGYGGGDDPDFIQHIHDLMTGRLPGMNPGFVAGYASYFEALADGGTIDTRLNSSTTHFPRAAALYRTLFGH